jgi:hypothetical protein
MISPSPAAIRAPARTAEIGTLSVSPCESNHPSIRSLIKYYAYAGCRRMVTAFCPHQGLTHHSGGDDLVCSATRKFHPRRLRSTPVSSGSPHSRVSGPRPATNERNHR